MKASVMKITPAVANKMLHQNKRNRILKPYHVEFLARQMSEDKWVDNGQPIQFDEDGDFINGQHRLHAIVRSGKSQNIVVVTGLPKEAFKTIDVDSAPRGLSTVLHLEGYANYTQLAAIIGIVNRFLPTGDYSEGGVRMSTADAEDILLNFPELTEWAKFASRKSFRDITPCSISFIIGTAAIMGRSNWGRVSPVEFATSLASGENCTTGDPVFTLRNRLLRIKLAGGNPRRGETINMMIRAWNATQQGKSMRSITSQAKPQRIRNLPPDFAEEYNHKTPQ